MSNQRKNNFIVYHQRNIGNILSKFLISTFPVDGRGWVATSRTMIIKFGPCTWWRHQMETFSALLTICAGNSPVTVEFPSQRPVKRGFDVFFDLRLNKRFGKHSWGWWFETQSRSFWRHCNVWTLEVLRYFTRPRWYYQWHLAKNGDSKVWIT